MKHNLMVSYCTFIVFYLLMKVEGKPTEKHPVIYKLAHIKTLMDKLKPLDEKMEKAIVAVLAKGPQEPEEESQASVEEKDVPQLESDMFGDYGEEEGEDEQISPEQLQQMQ